MQLEEETPPLPKKPRPDQPSNGTNPSTNSKPADSSYLSTTKKSKGKKSKKKSSQTTTTTTASSVLPSDFFDSGVSKTFHGHGEDVYYESSSESEGEGERRETGADGGGESGRVHAAAPPPGVPPG